MKTCDRVASYPAWNGATSFPGLFPFFKFRKKVLGTRLGMGCYRNLVKLRPHGLPVARSATFHQMKIARVACRVSDPEMTRDLLSEMARKTHNAVGIKW